MMPLTMHRVCLILIDMGMRGIPGPLGINLAPDRSAGGNILSFRIENGSGIAGRANAWRIVTYWHGFFDHQESTESVTTAKELRRLLREWATDEQKPERPGYKYHAQMNHNKWGDSYVWVKRKA